MDECRQKKYERDLSISYGFVPISLSFFSVSAALSGEYSGLPLDQAVFIYGMWFFGIVTVFSGSLSIFLYILLNRPLSGVSFAILMLLTTLTIMPLVTVSLEIYK